MPQATRLVQKCVVAYFFIAENVCEKAWRRAGAGLQRKNSCVRPQNRLIREKRGINTMAFGHWKQKYAVRPGNCKIPVSRHPVGGPGRTLQQIEKMIKIFQKRVSRRILSAVDPKFQNTEQPE